MVFRGFALDFEVRFRMMFAIVLPFIRIEEETNNGVESKEQDKFLLELLEKRTEGKNFKEIQDEAEKIGVTEDKIFEFAAKVAVKRGGVSPEEISDGINFQDKLKLAEIAQIQFENSGQIGIKTPQERGAFLS